MPIAATVLHKPGIRCNIELKQDIVQALEVYCQNTGATRKEALEYALSHLPTFNGVLELPGWAHQLQEQFIDPKHPFVLNYRDAADASFAWTVRYLEFAVHERRTYLDFWADETAHNQDIEPLRHNWSVRLDRIVSVEPVLAAGQWKDGGLDTVEVEFLLFGGLSYAYAKETAWKKPGDFISERLDSDTRRVKRRISNTFWFLREIVAYLDAVKIVAPDEVRQLLVDKVHQLLVRYS